MTYRRLHGFTLIELIAVMAIIGILAIVALPRLTNTAEFDARGFADEAVSMIRYAQKTAVAQRRNVCVTVAGNAITLNLDTALPDDGHAPNCTVGLVSPTGENPFFATAPNGVILAGGSFAFTAAGIPNSAVNIALTVTHGGITRTINIAPQTGHVSTDFIN
jgi:MSHA pilin protein MshC